MVADMVNRGHEVGHHGYMHEPPSSLIREREIDVIESGIRILSGITGEKPLGYRSPSWELSEHSLEILTDHGFIYDSSLMGDDAPYIVDSPANGKTIVELPIHWLLDDAPNFVYAPVANRLGPMRNPDEVYGTWAAEFKGLYRYGRAFTLTMHPQYIGRPGRLRMLERLITHIRTFPDEFERSDAAIANAIHRRMVLDQKLRAELRAMGGPGQSMRNKVGLYRIISENLREIENLQGLHVERHAHTDEEGNPLGLPLLVASRETLGEMLDRLDREDAAEGAGNNDPPDVEG